MSTPINDGGPAFPLPFNRDPGMPGVNGISVRDWFAGQALAGEVASWQTSTNHPADHAAQLAVNMYRIADAMIAARTRAPQEGKT